MDSLIVAILARWNGISALAAAETPWDTVVPPDVLREKEATDKDYAVYQLLPGSGAVARFFDRSHQERISIQLRALTTTSGAEADYQRAIQTAFDDSAFALTDGHCDWMKRRDSLTNYVGKNGRGKDVWQAVVTYEAQVTPSS